MSRVLSLNTGTAERRFLLVAWVGCITNLLCLPISLFLHGTAGGTILCAVITVVLLLLSLYGKVSRRFTTATGLMLAVLVLIEFPFLYFTCGLSCLPFLLVGIAGVSIFVHNRRARLVLVLNILYDVGVIVFSHYVSTEPGRLGEGDSLSWVVCSFILAAGCLSSMLYLLVAQYEQQARQLGAMTHALKDAAITDPLTHVYNRRYLTGYLGGLMRQPGADFSVALLDIDHFKNVNDQYGHVFGDTTLAHFAAACSEAMEGSGIVARYGGEEFMLVFTKVPISRINETLRTIRSDFLHFSTLEKGAAFTFSGGVAEYRPNMNVAQLFRAADDKLYRAKNSGRNKIVF